jgi:hypothetical protein
LNSSFTTCDVGGQDWAQRHPETVIRDDSAQNPDRITLAILGNRSGAAIALSASADLGYTVGGAETQRGRGVDVRVWQYRGPADWKLLADLTSSVATP